MVFRTGLLVTLLYSFTSVLLLHAAQDPVYEIIDTINAQIQTTTSKGERAKLLCYRARNYEKIRNTVQADSDYNRALAIHRHGWILNEYGFFLYRNGEYQKAYKVVEQVLSDFPHLAADATILKKKLEPKYLEAYYAENPPTIIMNSRKDPDRVTRHDLLRKQKPKVIILTNTYSRPQSKKSSKPKKVKKGTT